MREWMIALREAQGLTLLEMARKITAMLPNKERVGVGLLEYLEYGSVTLPYFAVWIAKAYGMTEEQMREIGRARPKGTIGMSYNRDPNWYEHTEKALTKKGGKAGEQSVRVDYAKLSALFKGHEANIEDMSRRCGMCTDYFSSLLFRAKNGMPITPKQAGRIEQMYDVRIDDFIAG